MPSRLSMIPLVLLAAAAPVASAADVKFASPFASHMVLQRDKPLPVWGTADAGVDVAVAVGDHRATAQADATGHWTATVAALPAGGPFTLTATAGGKTATADDVLVGDVFLCSGQSNMQFGLNELADAAAIAATPLPKLRLGKVALNAGPEPKDSFDLKWQSASPESAKSFSALAYCFAHELYKQDPKLADVPIGLLEDCMGATVIESWMPKATLAKFDKKSLQMSMFGIGPSVLYNGMIAPLKQLPLTGVIWYQGEGNGGEPARYAEYLPLMMKSWRDQLAQPDLPFMIVQLPDYAPDWGGVYWQWIRESQSKAAAATPHAAVVVSTGTNDGWDLHPQGKHEIGRRLALLARQMVYNEPVPGRSPTMKEATAGGDSVRVTFDTDGSTLTSGLGPVTGFELAGDDGVYHAATAAIEGTDAVVVRSAAVTAPKTVRYAWAGVPRATLVNAEGIPAIPFRTDDQPVSKGHGEVQQSPVGYVFKTKAYHVTLDGNGHVTSLVSGYQQFLSNADGNWGGTNIAGPGGNWNLSHITTDGPAGVTCANGGLTVALRFDDAALHWTITNKVANAKEPMRFTIALSPSVTVDDQHNGGPVKLRRKGIALTAAGVDKVTTFNDPSADPGNHVLEVAIPPGATKTLDLTFGQ